MIYYNKQEAETEGAIFVKDIGWFSHEEMGIIPEAEKNCLDYYITYKLDDYYTDEVYEEEEKTPTSVDCLIDGGKHIGFCFHGISMIFDEPKDPFDYTNYTRRSKLGSSYKHENGKTVMPHVEFFFSLSHIDRFLKEHKVIDSQLFSGYPTINELIIPEGVEVIKNCAFSRCKNLRRIVIPRSVKTIEEEAFSYCPSLDEVYILGAADVAPLAFKRCDHLTVSFGPEAKINYYSFYIYERYGKIGGSAYWTSYGFDHYAVDKVLFDGTREQYIEYLDGNPDLKEYLECKEAYFYSESEKDGCWRFVDRIPTCW